MIGDCSYLGEKFCEMAPHFLHDCFLLASFSFLLPPCVCFRLNMELEVSLD